MVAGVDYHAHFLGAQHPLGAAGDDSVVVRETVVGAEQPKGRHHHPVAGGVEQGRALPFVDEVANRSQAAAPRANSS